MGWNGFAHRIVRSNEISNLRKTFAVMTPFSGAVRMFDMFSVGNEIMTTYPLLAQQHTRGVSRRSIALAPSYLNAITVNQFLALHYRLQFVGFGVSYRNWDRKPKERIGTDEECSRHCEIFALSSVPSSYEKRLTVKQKFRVLDTQKWLREVFPKSSIRNECELIDQIRTRQEC